MTIIRLIIVCFTLHVQILFVFIFVGMKMVTFGALLRVSRVRLLNIYSKCLLEFISSKTSSEASTQGETCWDRKNVFLLRRLYAKDWVETGWYRSNVENKNKFDPLNKWNKIPRLYSEISYCSSNGAIPALQTELNRRLLHRSFVC